MTKMNKLILVLPVLVLTFVSTASAQVLRIATMQIVMGIPQVLWVDLGADKLVFEEEDFDITKDAILLEEGILATKPAAVRVRAGGNIGYAIYASSLGDAFVGPRGARLPTSQMGYRRVGSSEDLPWQALKPKDSILEPILVSPIAGESTFDMDYRLLATWQDAPGTYEGVIVYTVVPLES